MSIIYRFFFRIIFGIDFWSIFGRFEGRSGTHFGRLWGFQIGHVGRRFCMIFACRPKGGPRASKSAPRAAKSRPRAAPERPTVAQERPKSSQERPKSTQKVPKRAQKAPNRAKRRKEKQKEAKQNPEKQKKAKKRIKKEKFTLNVCTRRFPFTAKSGCLLGDWSTRPEA